MLSAYADTQHNDAFVLARLLAAATPNIRAFTSPNLLSAMLALARLQHADAQFLEAVAQVGRGLAADARLAARGWCAVWCALWLPGRAPRSRWRWRWWAAAWRR